MMHCKYLHQSLYRASYRAMKNFNAGFSLIEILVAVFIVSTLIILYGAGVKTISLSRETMHEDIALNSAGEELEMLRAGGYASLPNGGTFSNSELNLLPSGSGTMTITAYNSATKQVTVTVTWQEETYGSRSVSLSTFITQTGGLL